MRAITGILVALAIAAGCGGGASDADQGRLVVTVLAGPTCPVEQAGMPCDPRPPQRATLVIETLSGDRVTEVAAREGGVSVGDLEVGRYRLVARPVHGLMGTPAPVEFSITAGDVTRVRLTYDTGIR